MAGSADARKGRHVPRARSQPRSPRPKLYDQEVIDFFESKVIRDWRTQSAAHLGPCHGWGGPVDPNGYSYLQYRGIRVRASRYAYRLTKGPIRFPHLDHLCHSWAAFCQGGPTCLHRLCVNSDHLESVTARENTRRAQRFNPYRAPTAQVKQVMSKRCPRGHVWSGATTLYDASGRRLCGDCLEGLY